MALSDMLGGLLGGSAGKEDMSEAAGLSREAVEQLKQLYVPTIEEQQVLLRNPELAGLLEAEQLQDSRLSETRVDPRLRQAQMSALEEMAGLAQTGLGAQDKAAFNELRRQAGAEAQAQNAAALQNAAAQGTLDSGNTLMAQLMGGQQAANRASVGGDQLAAQAAQARRDALQMKANMSTQMGQQDFNQKSQIAAAQDAISKFNTQNRQDVNQFNLQNRQNIANQAASTANQQEMHNKGLNQQRFQNQLSKATGVAGQTQNLANQYAQQGQAAAQGQANMMGGLLNAGASIGGAYLANKKAK
jgi:hypothetical protein